MGKKKIVDIETIANLKDSKTPFMCVNCSSSELRKDQVYTSRNKLLDTHFTLCKACACRIANNSIEELHMVLRMLDIPFLPDIYKSCEGKENVFSEYMLRINNPKKKHIDGRKYMILNYKDSPTLNQVTDVEKFLYASDEEYRKLKDLFGDNWTNEELLAMNNELDTMFIQYGGSRDELAFLDIYTEIVNLKWLSRKAHTQGDVKTANELSGARQKILNTNGLNLKAIKESKSEDSLGLRIDWVESEPIIPNKKWCDIDGIGFMFDKLRDQLLRFVGANKTPVEIDAQEMIQYVEEHPDYCDEMV